MIKLVKVDKYFNKHKRNKIHVINNTSLEFDNTGLVSLLGPSGSGKTTLLNVIGGLDKVGRGKIYINGKKITWRSQNYIDKVRNLNIGYIFQDYKLVEDESVYNNVALSLKLIGIKDKKEIRKRVLYVLDKVGMLRYKNRPCNMLSGGERQRVGIARAIVKNPNIIIADEPTGNLDSKNSVEIMNIIKAISKEKLVILVTHEKNLAKFYSSRIIEIEDGKIVNDYINNNEEDLDYEIVNNLYLKDYKYLYKINDSINMYTNTEDKINIDIVVSNNNIYIKSKDIHKIEVIDDESNIEMINDHYKNVSKKDIEIYNFNYKNIINEPKKIKYSSIFNPITFITNGFNKVLNYSLVKKLLLIGFFLSGIFIMYSVSTIKATLTIRDKDFVTINKNYITVVSKKNKVEDFIKIENDPDIEYVIPTNSELTANIRIDDFYQFYQDGNMINLSFTSSIADIKTVTLDEIIYGRTPYSNNEVFIDKIIIDKLKKEETSKMTGVINYEDYLNRTIVVDENPNNNLKIVGIVDTKSPSLYIDRSMFYNVLLHLKKNSSDESFGLTAIYEEEVASNKKYEIYKLNQNRYTLKEGREPVNDYEVIVDISNKNNMKLNKEINTKINDRKLVVVGYYDSKENLDIYFVNENTLKYYLITKKQNISIYPKEKEKVLNKLKNEYKLNARDSYIYSKEKLIKERKGTVKATIISSGIILIISLIEILLMTRSSFLSRIKEVGIYRAIGVKKKDIYIMFSGEIIAITLLCATPGIILCAYILSILKQISYISDMFIINGETIIFSLILVLLFNLLVGLIPVFVTIRKRPAEILARTDI